MKVEVVPGEPLELALKRFTKRVSRDGILLTFCRRARFVAKGERLRNKSRAARKRMQ